MNRTDRENLIKTERGKFIRVFFRATGVHLVDRDQNGFAAAPQFFRNFAVERDNSFLHVDNKNDGIRGFNGDFHLCERGFDNHIVGFFAAQQTDAAGVYEREGFSVPLGLDADAVARDAGLVMHDRNAFFDDAIEQRGFPDVWPTNNGNQI